MDSDVACSGVLQEERRWPWPMAPGKGAAPHPGAARRAVPQMKPLRPSASGGRSDAERARWGESPPQLQHIACSDFPTMPVYAAPRRGQSLLIEILCACPDAEGLNFPMFISQHVNQQRPCCLLPQISPQPTGLLQHCGLSTTLPPHCPLSIESTWSSSAP